ncbi:MAG: sugar phosphate nucleotidyltransferase [Candidatus Aenigmatarchaeota archaeon]
MKALILAGGHATRLWPVTKNRAKPLLPLAGKPILSHILDELEGMDEVEKIYVTTNEKFEDEFRDFLKGKSDKNELIVEKQEKEEEKYGALGGILNVIKKEGEDDYLVIGGDNYYSFDIKDYVDFSKNKDSITNACYEIDDLEEAKNYGIVDFDEEKKIVDFEEKPENPKTTVASTACFFFPESKMNVFDEYIEYWDGRLPKSKYLDSPGRLLEWLVGRYDFYAYPFTGRWMDIGTRKGYLRAMGELEEGGRLEGEVKSSEVGENVTVLGDSTVKNSELENCIVLRGAEVENCVIKNSIVGRNTDLENKDLRNGIVKGL